MTVDMHADSLRTRLHNLAKGQRRIHNHIARVIQAEFEFVAGLGLLKAVGQFDGSRVKRAREG